MKPIAELAVLLLCASPAAAGPLEKACRDRYENGSPREINRACGQCLEKDPKNRLCRQAIEFLKMRPKLDIEERKPTGEAARQSQQHYLSGMVYFQKGDYEKARDEWLLAKQLDPTNADAEAGLEHIDKLYGPVPVTPR